MQLKAPRGTADILPDQIERWQGLQTVARGVFTKYGYREIVTPIFENTELFVRGIGDTTDVVSKEMYSFIDKGGRQITLRPEGTAPVVRAYLEHNMSAWPQPVKLFYIGPNFRYERPQAGRYRQFYQMGAEALGSVDPALDAEMIIMPIEIFQLLGLGNFMVKLNSIGCPICRQQHRTALLKHMEPVLPQLCETCRSRYEKNPLRILDCKSAQCQEAVGAAPHSVDYLCSDCSDHFSRVQEMLQAVGIPYSLDHRLVRGFDYYTKTVFEVQSTDLGAQSALGGGGRYDGLVEAYGGRPTPAVGVAAGLERVLGAMEKQGSTPAPAYHADAFVISMGNAAKLSTFTLTQQLRQAGMVVETDYLQRSMKSQMKAADRLSAKWVLIIGEDELARQVAQLRNMQAGTQEEVPLAAAAQIVCRQWEQKS